MSQLIRANGSSRLEDSHVIDLVADRNGHGRRVVGGLTPMASRQTRSPRGGPRRTRHELQVRGTGTESIEVRVPKSGQRGRDRIPVAFPSSIGPKPMALPSAPAHREQPRVVGRPLPTPAHDQGVLQQLPFCVPDSLVHARSDQQPQRRRAAASEERDNLNGARVSTSFHVSASRERPRPRGSALASKEARGPRPHDRP